VWQSCWSGLRTVRWCGKASDNRGSCRWCHELEWAEVALQGGRCIFRDKPQKRQGHPTRLRRVLETYSKERWHRPRARGTGVSGSGKSSLAFGTLYAEAQRRYLESVSPYARRLFHQLSVPAVDSIDGLPPAVALQQQRGAPTTRSSVGSVTTLSNLIRMLYSRAGDYPQKQPLLYAESFSPNTVEGACTKCHGLGRIYEVTEKSMVPNPSLTIRERAIAA